MKKNNDRNNREKSIDLSVIIFFSTPFFTYWKTSFWETIKNHFLKFDDLFGVAFWVEYLHRFWKYQKVTHDTYFPMQDIMTKPCWRDRAGKNRSFLVKLFDSKKQISSNMHHFRDIEKIWLFNSGLTKNCGPIEGNPSWKTKFFLYLGNGAC